MRNLRLTLHDLAYAIVSLIFIPPIALSVWIKQRRARIKSWRASPAPPDAGKVNKKDAEMLERGWPPDD